VHGRVAKGAKTVHVNVEQLLLVQAGFEQFPVLIDDRLDIGELDKAISR
jgi:hypothetical protein